LAESFSMLPGLVKICRYNKEREICMDI
jgi:hypothetical protein